MLDVLMKLPRKIPTLGLIVLGSGALAAALRPKRSFAGSVVLITGGSRGLGLELARQLARENARLVLCARSLEELERAGAEVAGLGAEVLILPCDISRPDEVSALIQGVRRHYGRLDVLINNASVIQVGAFAAQSEQDFRNAMDINFWGTYYVTREALPLLRESREAQLDQVSRRIVNITSIGAEVSVPHLLPYSCGKFAARAFSEGLQAELAHEGIRVTTVLPGLMRTGSFLHAYFKGRAAQEFKWFSMSASLPGMTLRTEDAARRILRAARVGRSFVTLGAPAKALRVAHANLPRLVLGATRLANRFLPSASDREREEPALPGVTFFRELGPQRLRAAGQNNEI
jgi:NAD(P)-dependent dehydrogenase (short-subunit alcohol dehydrogenase family)